jgi:hypothetical protein
MDTGSQDDANIVVQQEHEHRRRGMAAIIASEQSGWHPGMVPQGAGVTGGSGQQAEGVSTSFLANESQTDIDRFQPCFDEAVARAREVALKANVSFYEIEKVRFYNLGEEKTQTEDALWLPDDTKRTAHIAIRRAADPEGLTHEVGHCFFHPSPLHDRHNEDPQYGDKFCNGFRYVVHPTKGKSWMPNDGGRYDAHALVMKCPDLNSFSDYFVKLCAAKRQDMSKRILDGEGI